MLLLINNKTAYVKLFLSANTYIISGPIFVSIILPFYFKKFFNVFARALSSSNCLFDILPLERSSWTICWGFFPEFWSFFFKFIKLCYHCYWIMWLICCLSCIWTYVLVCSLQNMISCHILLPQVFLIFQLVF